MTESYSAPWAEPIAVNKNIQKHELLGVIAFNILSLPVCENQQHHLMREFLQFFFINLLCFLFE